MVCKVAVPDFNRSTFQLVEGQVSVLAVEASVGIHPNMLEYLGSNPRTTPNSSFPLMNTVGGSR